MLFWDCFPEILTFLHRCFARSGQICAGPGSSENGITGICPNSFIVGRDKESKYFKKARFLEAAHVGELTYLVDRRICTDCFNKLKRARAPAGPGAGALSTAAIYNKCWANMLIFFCATRVAKQVDHCVSASAADSPPGPATCTSRVCVTC